MKKIFISMPMRGKTDEQIKLERENAIAIITSNFSRERFFNNEEIKIIDSLISAEERENLTTVECLGLSISMLGKADYIVIVGDISRAKGCQIEKLVAQLYGIPILTLSLDNDGLYSLSPLEENMANKKLRDMTIDEVLKLCTKSDCHSCDFNDSVLGCLFGYPPHWLDYLDCEIEEADNEEET